jgi:TRAP-type transport system small permease protein
VAVFRITDAISRTIVGVAILVMVLAIFGQVFYRNVLDSYLTWAEEVARFSFVWLVFMGSTSAFLSRSHLSIDFIPEILSRKGRIILDTVVCLVVFLFMIVLVTYGWRLTMRTMTQTAPATGIIMGYIYIAMPISAVLMGAYSIVDLVRNIIALATGNLEKAAIVDRIDTDEASLEESGR